MHLVTVCSPAQTTVGGSCAFISIVFLSSRVTGTRNTKGCRSSYYMFPQRQATAISTRSYAKSHSLETIEIVTRLGVFQSMANRHKFNLERLQWCNRKVVRCSIWQSGRHGERLHGMINREVCEKERETAIANERPIHPRVPIEKGTRNLASSLASSSSRRSGRNWSGSSN